MGVDEELEPKDDPGGDNPDAGRNAERDFAGEKRSNESHASATDPDARLYEKAAGQTGRLCFVGTALMENRNGLLVDDRLTRASSVSECLAGIDLADAHIPKGDTLVGDKGFETADFVAEFRDRRITPHVAQNAYDTGPDQLGAERRSNIDGRTTRHAGYAVSQKCRKRIEEIFGPPWSPDHGPSRDGSIASCDRWLKTVAGWRKSRFRGLARTAHRFHLGLAACNLARMPELLVAEAG